MYIHNSFTLYIIISVKITIGCSFYCLITHNKTNNYSDVYSILDINNDYDEQTYLLI